MKKIHMACTLYFLSVVFFAFLPGCSQDDSDDDDDIADDDTSADDDGDDDADDDDDTTDDDMDDDTVDDDTADDDTADDDTTDIYEDACGEGSEETSWQPVAGFASVRVRFFFFDPEATTVEMLIDGDNTHLRVPNDSSGSCWMHLPPGHYMTTLVVDDADKAGVEVDLSAETTSMIVNYNHPTNGSGTAHFPLTVTAAAEKWPFNVLNITQDVKPSALDVYFWPKGTLIEDYDVTMPDKVISDLVWGEAASIEIEPTLTPEDQTEHLPPRAMFALVPSGTVLDPSAILPEIGMTCFTFSGEDWPFLVWVTYGLCADDSNIDDPNGPCYERTANPGTELYLDGVVCG